MLTMRLVSKEVTRPGNNLFFDAARNSYFRATMDEVLAWFNVNQINTCEVRQLDRNIKDVIFNDPATIVLWKDGTKTVVKCGPDDEYDPEKGLALCMLKKQCGNKGNYNNLFRKYLPKAVQI